VSLPVKKIKIWDDTHKISTNMSTTPCNSELDLLLPLFQDVAKLTQAKAAVEAAQEDGFCWVKTAG